MTTQPLPSEYGHRLLPTLVDQLSASDPDRVFLSYPLGLRPTDGYRDITYRELAAAINRCSWWLDTKLGRSDNFVIMYSAVKTGHKFPAKVRSYFLSSLGFKSLEDSLELLEVLQCRIMLMTTESGPPIAEEILSKRSMRAFIVPTLQDLLASGEVPLYPYTKTYPQAKDEPFVVLHTSGSTGRPIPVSLNHGTLAHHDLFLRAPLLGEKELNIARFSGKRVLLGLPHFHSAAICFLAFSVYSNTIPVLLPSPVSAEMVDEAHVHARVDASFLAPNTLADLVQNPQYFMNLKRLQYLTFGGSPLPQQIGDQVKTLAHLFVSFGTTECGCYALEETDPEDWQYASFSPIMGCELRPHSESLYELFFIRSGDTQKSQGVFSTFPSLAEYSAKDLYSKHPTKGGLWLYEGRTDDTFVFSDNERYCPQVTERILNAQPAVSAAIVCGEGRPKVALLIEAISPPSTKKERTALLGEIWPLVERINSQATSSQSQITEDLILFASMTKPMVRAAKGSVLRNKTAELYSAEMDQAFGNNGKVSHR